MHIDRLKILVLTDESSVAARVSKLFPETEYRVVQEKTLARANKYFNEKTPDLVIFTSASFDQDDKQALKEVERLTTGSWITRVIFLADENENRLAMRALRAGACNFVKLSAPDQELTRLFRTVLDLRPRRGVNRLSRFARNLASGSPLIGDSEPMMRLYQQINRASSTDMPVLLEGETGTGKDLAAQEIHRLSDRSDRPFIPVNLGAIPRDLVGSELFGHRKGAFTGAGDDRAGKFEMADGGTLFLDEIESVGEKVQVSLLRIIEQKKFYRLGGRKQVTADARLIAATNSEIEKLVEQGRFRADLFYRLDVFRIKLPPLRERPGDIHLLVKAFIDRFSESFRKHIEKISPCFLEALESYDWPGNVRELKNALQRAVLLCESDTLTVDILPERFQSATSLTDFSSRAGAGDLPAEATPRGRDDLVSFRLGTPLKEIEKSMLIHSLRAADENRTQAARMLGISRRSFYNKLRRHEIQ